MFRLWHLFDLHSNRWETQIKLISIAELTLEIFPPALDTCSYIESVTPHTLITACNAEKLIDLIDLSDRTTQVDISRRRLFNAHHNCKLATTKALDCTQIIIWIICKINAFDCQPSHVVNVFVFVSVVDLPSIQALSICWIRSLCSGNHHDLHLVAAISDLTVNSLAPLPFVCQRRKSIWFWLWLWLWLCVQLLV